MRTRCPWAGNDPLYIEYHDREWGVPLHDDRRLFEFLILEGAQAGLSWITILKKRLYYRQAFDGFDPAKVARYGQAEIEKLLGNTGLIRNRLKISAAVDNARAYVNIQAAYGSFDAYIWDFVDGRPVRNAWQRMQQVPDQTDISQKMSRELKARGFKFVGPVICYAFMQAVGMVNDHLADCFRHSEV
jgi:DNA-3-methyladenine glycosylase I